MDIIRKIMEGDKVKVIIYSESFHVLPCIYADVNLLQPAFFMTFSAINSCKTLGLVLLHM